jgi:hypothetical protein
MNLVAGVRILMVFFILSALACSFPMIKGKKKFTAKPSRSGDSSMNSQLRLDGIYLARSPETGFVERFGTRGAEHFALALYTDGNAILYEYGFERENDTSGRYRPWKDITLLASFLDGKLSAKPYFDPSRGGFKIDSSWLLLQLFKPLAHGNWDLESCKATIVNDSTLFLENKVNPTDYISALYPNTTHYFRLVKTAKPDSTHWLQRKRWFWKEEDK